MSTQALSKKKQIELNYVEEARRVSSHFPGGHFIPHEGPDFLIRAGHKTIGIEVTELCRNEPRAKAGTLSKVLDRAKQQYTRFAYGDPVDVSLVFSKRAEDVSFPILVNALVEHVRSHRAERRSREWPEVPDGYAYIAIREPLPRGERSGLWRATQAFDKVAVSRELVEARIANKNTRVADYRLHASEVWLLLVNDQFLGPGGVYAKAEQLHPWTLTFDFDKLLLFSHELDGNGEVIELRRASPLQTGPGASDFLYKPTAK
jgi:hypothetical protein